MRLKLTFGVLILVFLVAFSCTTKKPSQFDEVTVFRGTVVAKATNQPVENALVYLVWFKGSGCRCIPTPNPCGPSGSINIECGECDSVFTGQPTNRSGEYLMELRWQDLGFLFAKPADPNDPCQIKFTLLVEEPNYSQADTVFALSLEDRPATQTYDFKLEP